jgi:hypothetical protein
VPSASEAEVAIGKLKKYKVPGAGQIQAGDKILHSGIHKVIMLIWNKEELPQ